MKLKALVGSGHRVLLLTFPFLAIGLVLNIRFPSWFSVGGPPLVLTVISAVALVAGAIVWIWSAFLIVTRVPRQELVTEGPYSLVKHPLYTAMALLVLPWLGFLFNSWLGAVVGVALYAGARLLAREEEKALSRTFGAAWDEYCRKVKIPWL